MRGSGRPTQAPPTRRWRTSRAGGVPHPQEEPRDVGNHGDEGGAVKLPPPGLKQPIPDWGNADDRVPVREYEAELGRASSSCSTTGTCGRCFV